MITDVSAQLAAISSEENEKNKGSSETLVITNRRGVVWQNSFNLRQ